VSATSARAQPGELLLHPLVLSSFALLAFNDHLLKVHHPGLLSGKLSDVAFMIAAPLWLYVGGAWLADRLARGRFAERARHPWLLCCVIGIGVLFSAMQLSAWGDALYRHGLGLLQWPLRALVSSLAGDGAVALRPVQATPDPSDLLCLPLLGIAYALGRRSA
jgi:hypothetical protein